MSMISNQLRIFRMRVMMNLTIEMVLSPRLSAVNMVNLRLMFLRIETVHLSLLL